MFKTFQHLKLDNLPVSPYYYSSFQQALFRTAIMKTNDKISLLDSHENIALFIVSGLISEQEIYQLDTI
jgi:hypothetical protein